ncbi:unnamed protein product [Urochloa decumbens]|uniref:Uncharacterized protein n=1 Tax=Urochloa decumbens TaxID=240449 RepID=A0ABC8ZHI5_9POAL
MRIGALPGKIGYSAGIRIESILESGSNPVSSPTLTPELYKIVSISALSSYAPPPLPIRYTMGAFFFKVLRGTAKVHSPNQKKKIKVRREQPIRVRPAGRLRHLGRSWPQVVGLTAREAESRIKGDCPGVYCQVVSVNQLLTLAYSSNRVRIKVDRYGRVVKVPRVG